MKVHQQEKSYDNYEDYIYRRFNAIVSQLKISLF